MNNANRQMRSGATHDVHAPNFHALKRYDRRKTRIEIRMRIATENSLNRSITDSWADINREKERKRRIAKIRESFERTKSMAAMPNISSWATATGNNLTTANETTKPKYALETDGAVAVGSGALLGIMVKLYKNRQSGGNGEIVIVTDAKDVRDFIPDLAEATLRALEQLEGDDEYTLNAIFSNAFDVAFKLQGYKAERVVEQKLLTCGYSSPDVCDIIADTSDKSGPLTREAIMAAESQKANNA